MKLDAWLATLRAAARPLDVVALHSGAQRIAARAQMLTGNRTVFRITTTPAGVRISAFPPSPLARRALDRAVDEQMTSIQAEMANEGRERLISG